MDEHKKRPLDQISPDNTLVNSAKKHSKDSPASTPNTNNASKLVPRILQSSVLPPTALQSVSLLSPTQQTTVLISGGLLSPTLQKSVLETGVLSSCVPASDMSSSSSDKFSWAMFDAKLNSALDAKLQDVAKKSDLQSICADIQQLREENVQLKEDLKLMKSRLEYVEQFSKRSSIVVTGLDGNMVKPAIEQFAKLSTTVLKTSVNVTDVRRLPTGKGFVFTLNSAMEADAVIAARAKLKGSSIFIQKDSTADERHKMYNLRQLGRNIRRIDGSLKIRHGHSRIYINDKMFTWLNGSVVATKAPDAEFLHRLILNAKYDCRVVVGTNNSAAATSSVPESSGAASSSAAASYSAAAASSTAPSVAGTSFALSSAATLNSSPFNRN